MQERRIIPLSEIAELGKTLSAKGLRIVLTNGCFDILHPGHVRYLAQARELGDILVVGLNSDASVRLLKGEDRPINCGEDRAEVLSALRCVDYVTIFPQMRATELIHALRPHIYTKGGDYSPESLNSEELTALREIGTDIQILPLVPGKSTTRVIERLKKG